MVLAAGLGTRMRPLTLQLAKPELPVLGRPMILQVLGRLRRHGYGRATVNLHHLADGLRATLEAARGPSLPELEYSYEPRILGTAGGLRAAAATLRGDGPILVTNADVLADVDLDELRRRHEASPCPVTLVLAEARPGYSAVEVDDEGRVLSIAGAPEPPAGRVAARRLYTGCQMIDESVLDEIADGPGDIVRDVWRPLAAEGRLGSMPHDGAWLELGSRETYLECALGLVELPAELRRELCPDADPVRTLDDATATVGAGVRVQAGVRASGRLMLGFACHLGEGVSCAESIVMREAWLGPGARLERVVVGPGAEVPAGYRASGALLASATALPDGGEPPEGVRRDGALLVSDLVAGAVR